MRKDHAYTCLKLCHQFPRFQFSFLATFTPVKIPETQLLSSRKLRSLVREFAYLLRSPFISEKPILYYKRIHGHLIVTGLDNHVYLGNILMNMYSKLGCIDYAHHVFGKMPKRNLVSWSTMIGVYAQHGFAKEALMIFSECRRSCDESPNEYVLASVLRACVQVGDLALGSQVHGFVVDNGLCDNVYVGTALMILYAKIGDIDDARIVFDQLKEKKSMFTWAVMMKGYVRSGRSDVTLMLFHQMMRNHKVIPDQYVLSVVLSACAMLLYLEGGKQIHAYVLRRQAQLDVSLMNALVDFYVKCGKVECGRKLFDQIDAKDVISWTTIIAGCMQNMMHASALRLFQEMNVSGFKLDDFVCSSILSSCGSLEASLPGKQVHAYIIKASLESDEYVINGLIDMYSKCDLLDDARKAFDSATQHSVISYNTMIEGFSRMGKISEALHLFYDMMNKQLYPNLVTIVSILGALASLSFLELSRQMHCLMIKVGVSSNLFASSALIDVYCKCNLLGDARLVYNEISEKDVVVWNSMLFGYTQHLENEEALKLYNQLQVAGQKADDFTFVAVLNAASNLASLRLGQQLHTQTIKNGLDSDGFVMNALLDMYAKCGCLEDAYKLFNRSNRRDVTCWNTMISTFANHGLAKEALSLYDKMLQDGLEPNYVTFIGLLSACSHAGLIETGLKYFNTIRGYGIKPGMEHYACMVSLFGRAGKLNYAKEFIDNMPIKPAAIVWRSLLSACQPSCDYELGAYAAKMAISSEPADSGSYILLSNIYASNGMWVEMKDIRERMESNLVVKEPGCSWIEINDKVETFVSRDKSRCKADVIFTVLDNLTKEMKGQGHLVDNALDGNYEAISVKGQGHLIDIVLAKVDDNSQTMSLSKRLAAEFLR